MDKIKNDILTLGSITKLVEPEDFEIFFNKLKNVDYENVANPILQKVFRYINNNTQDTNKHLKNIEELMLFLEKSKEYFEIKCRIRNALYYDIIPKYFPKIDIKLFDIETIKNNFLSQQTNFKNYHADLIIGNKRKSYDNQYVDGFEVKVIEDEYFYDAKKCDNLNKLEFTFHYALGVNLTLVDTSKYYPIYVNVFSKNINVLSDPELVAKEFIFMLKQVNDKQPFFNFVVLNFFNEKINEF